jgi:hypothetical protein
MSYRLTSLLCLCVLAIPAAWADCKSEIPRTTPGNILLDNGDGTVTDWNTGLMWKQCSEGQNEQGCAGTASVFDWQAALQVPDTLNVSGGYAGHTDWRLPNIKELRSIVEEACFSPAINSDRFPNTPHANFWSSSVTVGQSGYSWYVYFRYGVVSYYGNRSGERHVRLVRDVPVVTSGQ